MRRIQYDPEIWEKPYDITVIFKDDPNSDEDFGGTHSITYEKSTHQFTTEHMIIFTHKDGFVEGQVFPIKSIKSFKWQ